MIKGLNVNDLGYLESSYTTIWAGNTQLPLVVMLQEYVLNAAHITIFLCSYIQRFFQ